MRKQLSSILIVMTVLIYTPLVQGALYKWIDKQGIIHFSDTPPENGQYEAVTQSPLPPDNPDAQNKLEAELKSQKETEENQQKEKQVQLKAIQADASRAATCRQAKEQLATLVNRPSSRIMTTDPDGTQRRLTEEEYQSHLTEANKQIADYCGE